MVSEVGAGRYGAGRAREGSTRGEARVMGRSAAGAAVGVAEEEEEILTRSDTRGLFIPFSCLSRDNSEQCGSLGHLPGAI